MARCTCPEDVPCSCAFTANTEGFRVSGDGSAASPANVAIADSGWVPFSPVFFTYFNSYTAYAGATYDVPAYRVVFINSTGGYFLFLRGRLNKVGAFAVGQQILSGLNAFMRPVRVMQFVVPTGGASGDNGFVEIRPDGTMWCQSTHGSAWIQLDGLHYTNA